MSLNDTIAELYVRKGQALGQGALGAGQAYGSALSNIGQIAGNAITQATDPRQQMARMQLSQAQQLERGNQVVDAALKGSTPQGPAEGGGNLPTEHPYLDANGLVDIQKLNKVLQDSGVGHLAPELLKGAETQNDAITKSKDLQTKFAQQQSITLGTVANTTLKLMDAGMSFQDAATHASAPLLATGLLRPDQFQKTLSDLSQLPPDQQAAQLQQMKATAARLGPTKKLGPNDKEFDMFGDTIAANVQKKTGIVNGQVVDLDTGAPIGSPVPKQVTPLTPEEAKLKDAQLKEINAKLSGNLPMSEKDRAELKLQQDRLAAEILHWRAQDVDAAVTLTPEALKLTAHQYAMTGQLPPMGMGKAGAKVRTEIINAAADEYKTLDLPAQIAAYKANQASLVHTQGTLDNLTAFEKAASKNIDTFIDLTKNLPDSGVPWANIPIRLLSDKMVGNDYQPAINAARQIATREVARVVNDPGLKGQLTDAARKSVEDMASGDITIAQLKQVMPVLKADMANVHTSLGEQLSDIQHRIATPPGGSSAAAPTVAAPPAVVLPGFSVTSTPKK